MPHMHVYDAFHAETALIPVARLNGITNAIVAPASGDTLPGQDSFIQLAGASATRDVAHPRHSHAAELHRRTAPQRGRVEKRKVPSTRMGMAAQLRQAFLDAQDYEQKLAAYEQKKSAAATPEKSTNDKEEGEKKRSLRLLPSAT